MAQYIVCTGFLYLKWSVGGIINNSDDTASSVWNEVKAIQRLSCSPELILKIAILFLRDAPIQLQQIGNAISARDYETTRIAAHSLFGTSTNFCTKSFEFTCQKLQHLLRQKDWLQAEQCFVQLKSEYEELAKQLTEFIARN